MCMEVDISYINDAIKEVGDRELSSGLNFFSLQSASP